MRRDASRYRGRVHAIRTLHPQGLSGVATRIALLRAVNGETGKLPMADLRAMRVDAGFAEVRTCIVSRNVLLDGFRR